MTKALTSYALSLKVWYVFAISFLCLTCVLYGIFMVSTVKNAAAKEQYTSKQSDLALEVGLLENEFYAIKGSYSAESNNTLVQVTNTTVVPTRALGVAYTGSVR